MVRTVNGKYKMKRFPNGKVNHLHIYIAEHALGKQLPAGAIVHHMDGNSHNNKNDNLVVCPDQAYHLLLHVRQRALDACGNPDWRVCVRCKEWDKTENMASHGLAKFAVNKTYKHRACDAKFARDRRIARKEKACL